MNDRIRYQVQSIYREEHGVSAWRGVDPVTGLPVLIYRFRGTPHPGLTRLDSDQLPRLLAWREEDGDGLAVVTFSSAWVPPDPGQPLTGAQLLDSAQALADAEAAGVTHGDLNRERFLIKGDTVVIEGFGIPWDKGEQSVAADVQGWAQAVMSLGHPDSSLVREVVREAASPLESDRPAPAELVARLRAGLLGTSGPVTATAPEPPETHEPPDLSQVTDEPVQTGDPGWDDFDEPSGLSAELENTREAFGSSEGSAVEPDQATEVDAAEPAGSESHEFRPSQSFASERFSRSSIPAELTSEPVKATPSADSAQEPEERRPPREPRQPRPAMGYVQPVVQDSDRRSRRIIMLVVLVLLSVVLAVLAFRWSDQAGSAPAGGNPGIQAAVTYVMDVVVDPDDLGPVDLYVLQSPPGSQLPSEMRLGTAPRRIALDSDGTWIFEGRFQGRTSGHVTVNLPGDRASTITIAIPPATEGD